MQEEHDANQCDDGAFFHESAAQRFDGSMDERRAVVDRHNVHALGQAAGELANAPLDVVDDIERVGAEALQHDAAGDLAIAVEFGEPPAFIRSKLYLCHVANENRRAAVALENDFLQIPYALEIATPTHDVFEFGQFDGTPAHIHVARADRVTDLRERYVEGSQPLRIDHHIVLLDEAADAGDFCDALGLGEAVAHVPILQ